MFGIVVVVVIMLLLYILKGSKLHCTP
jgi:hypothetical protein